MNTSQKFIGGGIIFPIELNSSGRPNIYSGVPLIRASILHILNWPIAHRYFNERFGCRLEECLEEPSDGVTMTVLKHFVIEALQRWEKRVIPQTIETLQSADRTTVFIKIKYYISGTKQADTFIFPFYKNIIY